MRSVTKKKCTEYSGKFNWLAREDEMTDRKKGDRFAAENAASRIGALAELIIDGQISERDGAARIRDEYVGFMTAIEDGSPISPEAMSKMVFGLGVALHASLKQLSKKGPVMVRYIDGDALVTMLMPDGPPEGMGG